MRQHRGPAFCARAASLAAAATDDTTDSRDLQENVIASLRYLDTFVKLEGSWYSPSAISSSMERDAITR